MNPLNECIHEGIEKMSSVIKLESYNLSRYDLCDLAVIVKQFLEKLGVVVIIIRVYFDIDIKKLRKKTEKIFNNII